MLNIALQVFYAIVYISVIIMTLLGNSLVILAYLLDSRLRNPSNALFVSLSIADFLLGAFSMSFNYLYQVNGEWSYGKTSCFFWLTFSFLLTIVSSNHLVLIALDRYQIVYEGLPYLQRRNMKTTVIIPVFVVWLLAFWVVTPFILNPDDAFTYCSTAKSCLMKKTGIFVFYTDLAIIVFPGILILCLYTSIFQGLKIRWNLPSASKDTLNNRRRSTPNHGTKNDQVYLCVSQEELSISSSFKKSQTLPLSGMKLAVQEKKERKAAKTLGILILLFFVCWTPYITVMTSIPLGVPIDNVHIRIFAVLLGMLNSCLNPIVYANQNEDFRNALHLIWRKLKRTFSRN